jgi:hypothetical protein
MRLELLLVAAFYALLGLVTSCSWGVTMTVRPRPVCGRLDPEAISEFHRSHTLSNGANESSVEDLAHGDPDGGWTVCVERGTATIQNHETEQEIEQRK